MKVLVLNCGSSTLKFQVIETAPSATPASQDPKLASRLIDRIGDKAACAFGAAGSAPHHEILIIRNRDEAVCEVLTWLDSSSRRRSATSAQLVTE